MARRPELRCDPELPPAWTDEQLEALADWLELRAGDLRKGARQLGKAAKVPGASYTVANALYYRHACGAMRWLRYHLGLELNRRRNQRKVAEGGATRRAASRQ